jgi:hypothetical protein
MSLSFSRAELVGTNHSDSTLPAPSAQSCGKTQIADVGKILCPATVEQELDDVIADLGRAAEKAVADGDPTGARLYADRMLLAIASRTREHKARMTARIDRLIDELTFGGQWTDEVLNRSATHFDVPAAAVRRRMGGRAG